MYKHKLLVANPKLVDPIFSGKVVLLLKYDAKHGAEGFLLNGPKVGKVGYGEIAALKEMPKSTKEVVEKVESGEIDSVDLYAGGPCVTSGIYMLHGYKEFSLIKEEKAEFELGITFEEFKDQDSVSNIIAEELYFGNPNTLMQIIDQGKIHEGKFRFFMGISGWSPGQLESEISAGAWEVKDIPLGIVFDEEAIAKLVRDTKKQSRPWPQPSLN